MTRAPGAGAQALVGALRDRSLTVAVAESLTGGMVAVALVDVPGASQVLRGGVVAYATDLKASLLGVDTQLLAERGAVDAEVAVAMARGVSERLGADVGIATTGVAGPGGQDGHPPGTVHVAVCGPAGAEVRSAHFAGDRDAVRRAAVALALDLAMTVVASGDYGPSVAGQTPPSG
jgi:nicotinamide-nucleotide amidase